MRFRNTFMFIGSVLVLLLFVLTDPQAGFIQEMSFGASTVVLLSTLLKSVWFIGMLHAGRRALFDYIDMKTVFDNACQTSEGSGRALMGLGLAMIAISMCIAAAVLSN